MSTIVCQGLQSCLESQLMESRTLRLKLASTSPLPPAPFSQSSELAFKSCISDSNSQDPTEKCSNPDMGGWSFLQALSNISQKNPLTEAKMEEETENCSYVHPLVKRSLSTLSEKSLELCTENLGSETGTDIIEDSIFSFSSSSSSSSDSETGNCSSPKREQEPKLRQFLGAKKENTRSFPPPLTTISGSNSLRVRPHREDGRLIIQAVQAPSTQSCFEADRSHGRLRLSFMANYITDFDLEVTAEEENEGFCEDDEDREVFEEEKEEEGKEDEEEEEQGEEEEKGESDVCMSGEMDGNNLDVGVKMGMGKFQRPSRCKEGGHGQKEGLLNIEPFWVATS